MTGMEIETVDVPPMRLAGVVHRGPYPRISESFIRLFPIAEALGLSTMSNARYVAVYYDNPDNTPEAQQRALAAITVTSTADIAELREECTEPGRYLRATFIGSHSALATGWQQLRQHIQTHDIPMRPDPSFEIYQPAPNEDRTELYAPTRTVV